MSDKMTPADIKVTPEEAAAALERTVGLAVEAGVIAPISAAVNKLSLAGGDPTNSERS